MHYWLTFWHNYCIEFKYDTWVWIITETYITCIYAYLLIVPWKLATNYQECSNCNLSKIHVIAYFLAAKLSIGFSTHWSKERYATSDGTIWSWGKTMDTIWYCTKYRDTIRYDIGPQNALPYVTVNSPRLMQRSHWRVRTRLHAFTRHQR